MKKNTELTTPIAMTTFMGPGFMGLSLSPIFQIPFAISTKDFTVERARLVTRHSFGKARNKPIAVGHLHFGQRLRIDDLPGVDQFVLCKNVGGQSIDLIVSQRSWRRPWHRAADVI